MRTLKKERKKGFSIKFRVSLGLFSLVAIQGIVLMSSIAATGAISRNDIAVYDILSNQSTSRKNELQNEFNSKRRDLVNVSSDLNSKIEEELLENGLDLETLSINHSSYEEILDVSISTLADFIKYNAATGAFVVIDKPSELLDENKEYRSCVYIRDSSPTTTAVDNSDLLLEFGRVDIARRKGIAVDYLWIKDMRFSPNLKKDFYFKPLKAYASRQEIDDRRLHAYGYWSAPFKIRDGDVSIITYSLPLVLSNGTPYGVIGFELDVNTVSALMPSLEIPYDFGFSMLGLDSGDGIYNDNLITSGAYANRFLSGAKASINYSLIYEKTVGSVYHITSENFKNERIIGVYNEIALYETFSPFYNEKWVLTSAAPEGAVMSGSNSINSAIRASILATTIVALILSVFIMLYISGPIRLLAEKVRSIDPEKPVRLGGSGVLEIDELSHAFEILSDKVSESAAKMFKIIELVNMPMGSFEINYSDDKVNVSKVLFMLMNLKVLNPDISNIPTSAWNKFIATLDEEHVVETEDGIKETLYVTGSTWNTKRWFRVRQITENKRDLGVLIDITEEMIQKQKLEFERNYDSLTKLFNRQMFYNKSAELLKKNVNKVGIMMFADIDDLKYINDTYGHETGDTYIKAFAHFLSSYKEIGATVARISGDEFAMFMTGYETHEEARKAFDDIFIGLKDVSIVTPEGSQHKVRASTGISYYPYDSDDIRELIKYSDYAMYEIKHTIKGEVKEFSLASYNKNAFVINMKNVLDKFIEERRIRFAFQPIIDVVTGEVYGYEAFMRPNLREMKSPEEILRVARSQSKLYQVEKLTFTTAFSWMLEHSAKIGGKKIFINSIPNQIFTEKDKADIFNNYGHLLKNVVFDITENEFSNKEETKKKVNMFRALDAMVAIDDYGSGYSTDLALLVIEPDFIKLDAVIIRHIDKDADKQQLVQNITYYAAKKNVKVIAEAVENYEEMETLVRIGVSYIQGYYFARPNFEILDITQNLKDTVIEASSKYKK